MGFAGSDRYLASASLSMAVNAAIVLEKPLLIKGEPGTGKTVLAEAVADSLGAELISWHIKSTTKAPSRGSTNTMRWPVCGTPSSAIRGWGDQPLHPPGQAVVGLRRRAATRAPHRRDRQGRHRVSQRSAAGAGSHGVRRL